MPTYLRHNLGIGIQLQQSTGESCGSDMVVRLGKNTNSATQRDLEMRWRQLAVSEVGRELQIPTDVVRLILGDTSALDLQAHTKEIFP